MAVPRVVKWPALGPASPAPSASATTTRGTCLVVVCTVGTPHVQDTEEVAQGKEGGRGTSRWPWNEKRTKLHRLGQLGLSSSVYLYLCMWRDTIQGARIARRSLQRTWPPECSTKRHLTQFHDALTSLDPIPPHVRPRYLILTYRVEYDRVHYPLPLAFEDVPSVSSLQRVIRRLRKVRWPLLAECAAAVNLSGGNVFPYT